MNLLHAAIQFALRKPAPTAVPRTGEAAKGIDCFVVYIRSPDKSWSFLVDALCDQSIEGTLWDNHGHSAKCCLSPQAWQSGEFEAIHFVGPYEFKYQRPLTFLLREFANAYRFHILKDHAEQFFFNIKRLARTERIDALKQIIDSTISDPNYRTSPAEFMNSLHTYRWVFHPDRGTHVAYCRLLLDSLVESRDLQVEGMSYRLSPRALVTISQYEEEERKHRDSLDQQRNIKWLTFALVCVGLLQAVT